MQDYCDFEVGQLIEYRSWYDGDGSWVSIEDKVGIVLEIICISESEFDDFGQPLRLYDIKVYWISSGTVENVPDMLLCDFNYGRVELL